MSVETPTWTGTVTKPTPTSLVGISFSGLGSAASPVIIAVVRGLFKETELVPGLKVESVNGNPVFGHNAASVSEMVKASPSGKVTVVASGVVAKCTRENLEQPIGVTLKKNEAASSVLVSKINDDSILANAGLKNGQKITMVNGEKAPSNTSGVISMLKSKTELYVVAVDVGNEPDTIITAVHRESKETKVGLSIKTDPQSNLIVVSKISDDGLFAKTNVKVGQQLVSINGEACPDSSLDAIGMIKDIEATLTLVTKASNSSSLLRQSAAKVAVTAAVVEQGLRSSKVDTKKATTAASTGTSATALSSKAAEESKKKATTAAVAGVAAAAVSSQSKTSLPQVPAGHLLATAIKPEPTSSLGLSLQRDPKLGIVCVKSVNPKGLLANSDLKPGQRVVAINREEIVTTAQAISILQKATGMVMIEVEEAVNEDSIFVVPAGHILVTGKKPNESAKVGVSLQRDSKTHKVCIKSISSDGVMANSALKPGQRVVSINGDAIEDDTAAAIAKIQQSGSVVIFEVEEAVSENLTFDVQEGHLLATVKKPDPKAKLGITLQKDQKNETVCVKSISENGLFSDSCLKPGQAVVAINGVDVTSTSQAIELMQKGEGAIMIEVEETPRDGCLFAIPPGHLLVTAEKATAMTKLGVSLQRDLESNDVLVKSVSPEGLFANSALKPGLKVVKINEQPIKSTGQAVGLLQRIVGTVVLELAEGSKSSTFFAAVPESAPPREVVVAEDSIPTGHLVASIVKPTKDTKCGIMLRNDSENPGRVYVDMVREAGLFANTGIKAGQRVVAINDEPCPYSMQDAIQKIKDAEGAVKLQVELAETVPLADGLVVGDTSGNWTGKMSYVRANSHDS